MLLADIGNTRVHIYDNNRVLHLSHRDAFREYGDREIYYISVNSRLSREIKELKNWINISDKIRLKGSYETMGVDRKALCLSKDTAMFISAGSAITIDIVESGIYQGGFLLLGLSQHIKSYGIISPALETNLNRGVNIDKLPKGTEDGISYGVLAPLLTIIEKHREDKKIYISGGDGEFLSSLIKNSIYDERLIFYGIKNALGVDF
jgi:type III pantothenate kinase